MSAKILRIAIDLMQEIFIYCKRLNRLNKKEEGTFCVGNERFVKKQSNVLVCGNSVPFNYCDESEKYCSELFYVHI